jgi:hypothetical protein
MMRECIKEGFNLANNNLQLVLIRIVQSVINVTAIFVFIGMPVLVAVAYLGFDLAHARDTLPYLIEDPFGILSKYIGLIFFAGLSFFVYLVFIFALFLYVLSGTLGTLKNSAVNVQFRFSLLSFFKEANRNFFRIFRLGLLLFFTFPMIFISLVVTGGIAAGAGWIVAGTDSALEVFFSSFVSLSVMILIMMIFLVYFVFAVYSVTASFIDGGGVMDSIRRSYYFLKQKPAAFLFCAVLIIGFIALNLVFFLLRIPFTIDSVMAPIVNILFSLMNAVFHAYLAIVVWSSLIIYYVKGTNYPVYSATYEI